MDSGELCVVSIIDHMMQIPYADSLVTTIQAFISSQMKYKYSMQYCTCTLLYTIKNSNFYHYCHYYYVFLFSIAYRSGLVWFHVQVMDQTRVLEIV